MFIVSQPGEWNFLGSYYGTPIREREPPWPCLRDTLKSNRRWTVLLLPKDVKMPPDIAALSQATSFAGPDDYDVTWEYFEALEEVGHTDMTNNEISTQG